MSEETVVDSQGAPWTSVRYFNTFTEADTLRNSMKTGDLSGTLQVKVKRCGENGSMYVVKTRQTVEMTAAANSVEEDLNAKPQKKARKTKK